MIHQQNQHLAFTRVKLKTARYALRKNRARFRMWPGSDSLAGVMQQQRQIKDKRIGQLLEKFPIFKQFGIFRSRQRVELVNADQRVFIRGVAVKKFMLHQTSKLAELRNVLTRKSSRCISRKARPTSPLRDKIRRKISRGSFAYRIGCVINPILRLNMSASSGLGSSCRSCAISIARIISTGFLVKRSGCSISSCRS